MVLVTGDFSFEIFLFLLLNLSAVAVPFFLGAGLSYLLLRKTSLKGLYLAQTLLAKAFIFSLITLIVFGPMALFALAFVLGAKSSVQILWES